MRYSEHEITSQHLKLQSNLDDQVTQLRTTEVWVSRMAEELNLDRATKGTIDMAFSRSRENLETLSRNVLVVYHSALQAATESDTLT